MQYTVDHIPEVDSGSVLPLQSKQAAHVTFPEMNLDDDTHNKILRFFTDLSEPVANSGDVLNMVGKSNFLSKPGLYNKAHLLIDKCHFLQPNEAQSLFSLAIPFAKIDTENPKTECVSPLMTLVSNNNTYWIKQLIAHYEKYFDGNKDALASHINLNSTCMTYMKTYPLHLAICNQNFEVVKLLLDKGADPFLRGPDSSLEQMRMNAFEYAFFALNRQYEKPDEESKSEGLINKPSQSTLSIFDLVFSHTYSNVEVSLRDQYLAEAVLCGNAHALKSFVRRGWYIRVPSHVKDKSESEINLFKMHFNSICGSEELLDWQITAAVQMDNVSLLCGTLDEFGITYNHLSEEGIQLSHWMHFKMLFLRPLHFIGYLWAKCSQPKQEVLPFSPCVTSADLGAIIVTNEAKIDEVSANLLNNKQNYT